MMRRFLLGSFLLVLATGTFGCTGEPTASPDGTGLDRETFIETYVDLRTAVIRGDTHELTDEDRAGILAEHGVTEEQLVAFAEAHGADVAFMRDVWDEVEARLDATRLVPGSADRR